MCTLTGYSGPELLGMTFQEVTHADDVDADSEFLGRLLAGELSSYQMEKRYVRPSGEVRWALLSRSLVRTSTGKPMHFVTQAEDITERRQAQEELAHQAFHDPLTGLANRALLLDRLQHGLDRIGRHDATLAVFYLDVDNLKMINDTLGHEGGDEALIGVARALRSSARAEDTVARVGGDEFVGVFENLDDAAVSMVSQRMEHALAQVEVGTSRMSVGASIGIARASASENTADGLLRQADAAMYAVKLSRRAAVNDA
jgi:diguanylate cyclase (GGDEF)-like protein/PAS domain S-box-containing protein